MMASIRQYIHDLMRDKKRDPFSQIVKIGLLISSYMYGAVVRCHSFFYRVNLLKSYKASVNVISVGNITLGGTGKTPFAIMLAKSFALKGKKVAVLIRGYGEDEWKMLEEKLKAHGVKIFVGRDRVRSVGEARTAGANLVILDDGFQHQRLRRDVNIVLLDSSDPFGNRCLFPRGILREPINSLKRADIIVLTKTDKGKDNIPSIEKEIKKITPGKKIIKAVHNPRGLIEIWTGKGCDFASIVGKEVCLLSAICDASYFRYTAEKLKVTTEAEFIFPDHYPYGETDLKSIFDECKRKNIDTIITTEKDAVKLKLLRPENPGLRVLSLAVELEITEGKDYFDAGIF